MSKRIEELEKEKKMEEKDFNLKESSLGDFLNYIRVLAKLEERKLAEKEFKEDREALELYVRTKELEVEKLKKELGK